MVYQLRLGTNGGVSSKDWQRSKGLRRNANMSAVWLLFRAPLRAPSLWACALALWLSGYGLAWAVPAFTPLSSESSQRVLRNWAFLSHLALCSWVLYQTLRARSWVRGLSEAHLSTIQLLSVALLPVILLMPLALPDSAAWLRAGQWAALSLPFCWGRAHPARSAWIFFGVASCWPVLFESNPVHRAQAIGIPILLHLGWVAFERRSRSNIHTP